MSQHHDDPAFADRLQAVRERDPAADGRFVYSVSTTGIYCRPSCPARRAREEHIAFHRDPEAAEAAGFRPCRRCKPRGPGLAEERTAKVVAACRLIDEAEEVPALRELARAVGMSPYHFHRVFRAVTGLTPKGYADARRSERVREALKASPNITRAIFDAGYNANSRFYEQAARQLGMRPRAFREGGRGAAIRFAVAQCSLGAVLVGATGKGVCAISLGDDPDVLVRQFQDQFQQAELIGGDADFETMVARVIGFIDVPGTPLGLPLDVRGTAFQRQVWEALGKIPVGSTASYTQIALALGRPTAVRAVAQACASNRLAVAIPCHRVVRSDGELAGYRWGIERKHALLEREREAVA